MIAPGSALSVARQAKLLGISRSAGTLQHGDTVEIAIDGIGSLINRLA